MLTAIATGNIRYNGLMSTPFACQYKRSTSNRASVWRRYKTPCTINVVVIRRARLLLGSVTVCVQLNYLGGTYVINRPGQLSLPSLPGKLIEYRHAWLRFRPGCQVTGITLCAPIWFYGSEMEFPIWRTIPFNSLTVSSASSPYPSTRATRQKETRDIGLNKGIKIKSTV